jgi:hypothetical protein
MRAELLSLLLFVAGGSGTAAVSTGALPRCADGSAGSFSKAPFEFAQEGYSSSYRVTSRNSSCEHELLDQTMIDTRLANRWLVDIGASNPSALSRAVARLMVGSELVSTYFPEQDMNASCSDSCNNFWIPISVHVSPSAPARQVCFSYAPHGDNSYTYFKNTAEQLLGSCAEDKHANGRMHYSGLHIRNLIEVAPALEALRVKVDRDKYPAPQIDLLLGLWDVNCMGWIKQNFFMLQAAPVWWKSIPGQACADTVQWMIARYGKWIIDPTPSYVALLRDLLEYLAVMWPEVRTLRADVSYAWRLLRSSFDESFFAQNPRLPVITWYDRTSFGFGRGETEELNIVDQHMTPRLATIAAHHHLAAAVPQPTAVGKQVSSRVLFKDDCWYWPYPTRNYAFLTDSPCHSFVHSASYELQSAPLDVGVVAAAIAPPTALPTAAPVVSGNTSEWGNSSDVTDSSNATDSSTGAPIPRPSPSAGAWSLSPSAPLRKPRSVRYSDELGTFHRVLVALSAALLTAYWAWFLGLWARLQAKAVKVVARTTDKEISSLELQASSAAPAPACYADLEAQEDPSVRTPGSTGLTIGPGPALAGSRSGELAPDSASTAAESPVMDAVSHMPCTSPACVSPACTGPVSPTMVGVSHVSIASAGAGTSTGAGACAGEGEGAGEGAGAGEGSGTGTGTGEAETELSLASSFHVSATESAPSSYSSPVARAGMNKLPLPPLRGPRLALGPMRYIASVHIVMGHLSQCFKLDDGRLACPVGDAATNGWGFTWVPWFMMLSGFVLTFARLNSKSPDKREGSITFLLARLRSVYPVYLCGLLARMGQRCCCCRPGRRTPRSTSRRRTAGSSAASCRTGPCTSPCTLACGCGARARCGLRRRCSSLPRRSCSRRSRSRWAAPCSGTTRSTGGISSHGKTTSW